MNKITINGWTVTLAADKKDGPLKLSIRNDDHSLVCDKGMSHDGDETDGDIFVEEYYTQRQWNEKKS